MSDKKVEEMKLEMKFPAIGLTKVERDFYIELLKNCRDIKNPINLPNSTGGNLVEMRFQKENDIVNFNGSVIYKLDSKDECRCVSGDVFKHNNSLIVDMHVDRLKIEEGIKEYTTVDEFVVENGYIVKHNNSYNHGMSSDYSEEIRIKNGGIK